MNATFEFVNILIENSNLTHSGIFELYESTTPTFEFIFENLTFENVRTNPEVTLFLIQDKTMLLEFKGLEIIDSVIEGKFLVME